MTQAMDIAITEIAKRTLRVPTLLTRNSDSLDFHDVHVAALRHALEQAFAAGVASVKREG